MGDALSDDEQEEKTRNSCEFGVGNLPDCRQTAEIVTADVFQHGIDKWVPQRQEVRIRPADCQLSVKRYATVALVEVAWLENIRKQELVERRLSLQLPAMLAEKSLREFLQ